MGNRKISFLFLNQNICRGYSLRQFFSTPKTFAKNNGQENIYNFTQDFLFVYLNLCKVLLSLLDKLKVTSEHVLIIGHCPLMYIGKTVSLTLYIIFFYHQYLSQLGWRGGKIVDLCPEVLQLKVRTPITAYFFIFAFLFVNDDLYHFLSDMTKKRKAERRP